MTEQLEQELRLRLLDLVDDRGDSGEGSLVALLDARFPRELSVLDEKRQAKHLEVLRKASSRRPWLGEWVAPRSQRPVHRWAAPVAVAFALAALVGLILLMPQDKQEHVASPTPPTMAPGPQDPEIPDRRSAQVEPQPREQRREAKAAPDRPARPRVATRTEQQIGRFVTLSGEPTWRLSEHSPTQPIEPGSAIPPGAIIETGDADKVHLVFLDGTSLQLDFNTTLMVGRVRGASARPEDVTLTKGKVAVYVTPQAVPARFSVATPIATAQVLGTKFSLALRPRTANPDEMKAVLQVEEGKVAFFNEEGKVIAGAQTQSVAVEGSKPTEPERLTVHRVIRTGGFQNHALYARPLRQRDVPHRVSYPFGDAGLQVFDQWYDFDRMVPATGVRVGYAAIDSPARLAGLMPEDEIVALNGKPIREAREIEHTIWRQSGRPVTLSILRAGEAHLFSFTTRPMQGQASRGALIDRATWEAIVDPPAGRARLAALAEKSASPDVFNNLGVFNQLDGEMTAAIRCYQRAIQLNPRHWRSRYNLGMALLEIGNYDRSLEELRASAALAPHEMMPLRDLCEALIIAQRTEEAQALWTAAESRFGNDPRYWHGTASLSRIGGWGLHHPAVRKAKALDPEYGAIDAVYGAMVRGGWDWANAAEITKRALRVDPQERTISLLFSIYNDMRQIELAEEVALAGLQRYPNSAALLMCRTVIFHRWRYEEVEAICREAFRLDPRLNVFYMLAGSLEGQGRFAEAEDAWRHAFQMDSEFWHARANLGYLLSTFGRYEEATQILEETARHWHYSLMHIRLSRIYEATGRVDDAIAAAEKAARMEPTRVRHFDNLASILINAGRLEEAETALRRAIAGQGGLGPPLRAYVRLSILLAKTGRQAEAEDVMRQAETAVPGFDRSRLVGFTGSIGDLDHRQLDFGLPLPAFAFFGQHDYDLAYWELPWDMRRSMITARPFDPLPMSSEAWHLAYLGIELDEALRLALRAVELSPKEPMFQYTLGYVYAQQGEFELAEPALLRAIDLYGSDPASGLVWLALGQVYRETGRSSLAEQAFRRATKHSISRFPAERELAKP
jgi:tetratricopeptide (TPR) repeat protein